MSLLDRTLHRPGVLELCAHRHILPFYPSIRRRSNKLCCFAKVTVEDDEQKHETTRKGFSIRVPTIPNLKDIESARRMLESAFQALSFEMPKIPIESALQGLTFDIFKLSIPKQVLVFDITGFVATKLKKPLKNVEDVAILDEGLYPRCAWPRALKEARIEEVFRIGALENLQDQECGVNLVLGGSKTAYPDSLGHTMHPSPKADLSNEAELGKRPSVAAASLSGEASFKAPVGPHCAWPRKTHQIVNASGALSARSILRYPRSKWPRKSLSGNGVVLGGEQSIVDSKMGSAAIKEEVSPCIIEGGPRCSWPRKTMSAKQSYSAETTTSISEGLLDYGSQKGKDADDGKIASADFDGAAELPRRMLATSVGLSLVNHLVKDSIVTSLFDFCSLLPAGSLEIAEEEDVALDVGRRTLLVFIKHSAG